MSDRFDIVIVGAGHAGAPRVEQVSEIAQPRRQPELVGLRVRVHRIATAHHADHAAHPDHRVGRWRQPRLAAGQQGPEQRCFAPRLRLADGHADQRALGTNGEFVHLAVDAIGLGEITLGAARRHRVLAFLGVAQPFAPRITVVQQAGDQQGNADGQGSKHREGGEGRGTGRKVAVGRQHQVIEQQQWRIADHGQAAAHHDRRSQRQQQAGQADAGARGQARGHRQEQRGHRRVLHEARHQARNCRSPQHQPVLDPL